MHAPAVPADTFPAAFLPSAPSPSVASEFAMFTTRANKAVARMLVELAEQRRGGLRKHICCDGCARRALLARTYPEVYDTAVRDELWKHLSALGLSDASIAYALVAEPSADSLLGPPSAPDPLPGKTRQERNERQDAS